MRRRTIVRAVLFLLVVLLSAWLFRVGKGHTLLLDTNTVEFDGKELRSAEAISVSVDGREPEEMGRVERVIVDNLMGSSHSVVIEVISGEEKKIETSFTIPAAVDTALLRIAAVLNGAPGKEWVVPFVEEKAKEEAVEQTVHQEEKDVIQLKKPQE